MLYLGTWNHLILHTKEVKKVYYIDKYHNVRSESNSLGATENGIEWIY